jgi:hypothetical protein
MKPGQDIGTRYESTFDERVYVQTALKYDNRAAIARGLEIWPAAQNVAGKPAVGELDISDNPVSERFAEGYALAVEQPV